MGKTETAKHFTRAIGRPFMLWSCRGASSYGALSRILLGCAKGGFWLCLDELGQLAGPVLSACVSIVALIRDGLRARGQMSYEKEAFSIHPGCNIMATLGTAPPPPADLPTLP